MDNRYYLKALGITGLFVALMVLFWTASGGPASEAEVRNASSTRTSIALTGSYLLQPRTQTPLPPGSPTLLSPTSMPTLISPAPVTVSPTNTALFPQFNTPLPSIAPSIAPPATQTLIPQIPVTGMQDPAEFARWYFTRVWNERDYQNLWDNYLTPSYKANVGSGLYEDYVWWWNSVARVDIHQVDVLENNGTDARMRVHLTFHMVDGRVVENQVYEYDFLYDPSRTTWMFDASP